MRRTTNPRDTDESQEQRRRLGERLRAIRERRGKTRAEMGELVGVTEKGFGHYETGHAEMVPTKLAKVAEYLGVPVGYFFGEDTPEDLRQREVVQFFEGLPEIIQEVELEHLRALHHAHVRAASKKPIGGTRAE